MPNWINITIWFIWVIWSIQQLGLLWTIAYHNSNPIKVRYQGKYTFHVFGIIKLYLWIVFSFGWLCYNIFG